MVYVHFSLKQIHIFSNGPKRLHKNPLYCPIWCNWGFDNFKLDDELFEKLYKALKLVN